MELQKALEIAEEMQKEAGRDCIEDEMIQVFTADIMRLEEALQRIATERFPYQTQCRERYLRDIAKSALSR